MVAADISIFTLNVYLDFEVTVGADWRKDAITVTRTADDKFEFKIFRDRWKALRWCEKTSLAVSFSL
jgi:hypothetical protein